MSNPGTQSATADTKNSTIISQASILILAGVLMGSALGGLVSPSLRVPVFACGAVGAVGYLALSFVTKRRES